MTGVGVIGAGLMGMTHVRLLTAAVAGAEVVAVSDPVRASAERAAAEARLQRVHDDALELIADPRVDAVVIASPAATHEALVLACLQVGKPVLCEKPLTTTSEGGLRVVEAELASGRRLLQVGFMRRFDPGYAEIKARLDDGEVGAALLVHCAHRNPSPPHGFATEMILTDTAVHEMDVVRWLLGEEIVRVSVRTPRSTRHAAVGVRDPLFVLFETEAGVLAGVEAFVNAGYAYDIRCEVVGENGTLALPAAAGPLPGSFQERFASAYVNELQAWAAGEAAGAGAWDGYAAAVISEAAVESLHTGQPVEVALRSPAPPAGERSRPASEPVRLARET